MATTSPISSTTTRRRAGTISVKNDLVTETSAAPTIDVQDVVEAAKPSPASTELRDKIVIINGLYETPHWGVSITGDQENWAKAPKLTELAEHLVETCNEFRHLQKFRIEVLWKATGGTRAGEPVIAGSTVMGGLQRYAFQAHFLIWFAADHCKDLKLSPAEYEAAMYHELCHCGHTVNDDGTEKPRKVHGIEVFPGELKRFGLWRSDLQRISDAMTQQTLWTSDRAMAEGVL